MTERRDNSNKNRRTTDNKNKRIIILDIDNNKKYIVLGGIIAMIGSAYFLHKVERENPDLNLAREMKDTLEDMVGFMQKASKTIDITMETIQKVSNEYIKSNSRTS